ncbi:MAG: ribonuclease H-like domain-containing protein [SAR324 cluster bacterium]|nr:ribonuclease H-like domain-containing protein [SAR324 cluster bacterium]
MSGQLFSPTISQARKDQFLATIRASLAALQRHDLRYLIRALPTREHWRILETCFSEATFFDIETTGLSSYDSFTTVIVAYHQQELHTFVYGENLEDFLRLVDESRLLVAFNGNSFDIPFLENSFNIPDIGCPYIDLRWIFYHQGYSGGLKAIEKKMSLQRPAAVRHVDGQEAVLLFSRWQRGDRMARSKLIQYCQTDVLTTYLTAGLLLKEMGFEHPLPTTQALFAKIDETFREKKH